jgi:hypothetical protein
MSASAPVKDSDGSNTHHNYPFRRPRPLKTVKAAFDFLTPNFTGNLLRRKKAEERNALEKSMHVKIKTILQGTLDPGGQVQDVFYDAMEFGDGDHGDEFKVEYRRESVVLQNILAHSAISDEIEAFLEEPEERLAREQAAAMDNSPPPPPKPSKELPLRFLRAGKGNVEEGLKRYDATLQWRKEEKIDTILREPSPNFDLIKEHYPHYFHLTGKAGEPCFYEQPPKTNLKALKQGGVNIDKLLRHYAMVTEFQWQYLERDDLARSIYIIDLQGIRFLDFAGEVIDL